MTKVKMFLIAGDQTGEALAAEVAQTPDCHAEIFTCPKTIANIQPMPFIQVNGSERFYGQEGIRGFLAGRATTKPSP